MPNEEFAQAMDIVHFQKLIPQAVCDCEYVLTRGNVSKSFLWKAVVASR